MTSHSVQDAPVISLTYRNKRSVGVTFAIEPWGDEHDLKPSSELRIEFSGPEPKGYAPFMEWGDDLITAYAWSGTTVRVLIDGREAGVY